MTALKKHYSGMNFFFLVYPLKIYDIIRDQN